MPPTRRQILQGLGALSVGSALAACDNSESPSAGLPGSVMPGTDDWDFPMVTALPFAHGVASGDPLADRVIIWTRITERTPSAASIPVAWFVATDPQMQNVVRSGVQSTLAERDWTVKVDVTGLQPATSYYYRFQALGGESITGRTRTAPAAEVSELRIAVLACSSYWSSHWSGYGHIADRNDLDLVVHCGDYIYDFVDEDEQVRARNEQFSTEHPDYRHWINLDEIRRRYALWRSDPNHCRAHQQHPWSIIWDNHDVDIGYGNELPSPDLADLDTTTRADAVRAFYEWTPTRPPRGDESGEFLFVDDGSYPQPPDARLIWRKLDYGPMADIFCLDTWLYTQEDRGADASHLDGAPSKLSRPQYEWLTGQMLASQQAGKRWRLLVNQHWLAPVDVPKVVEGAPGVELGLSRWADYSEERARLIDYLAGNNPAAERIANNVIVSGDSHGSWASDVIASNALARAYQPGAAAANPRAGSTAENQAAGQIRASTGNSALLNNRAESVAVEFAPSSMGRGGADELVANANPGSTVADQVAGARAIERAVIEGNKNCQFIEWVDHGYGIVHLAADRALFEYWWQDKLTPGSLDVLGNQMVAFAEDDAMALPAPRFRDQIDTVTAHGLSVAASAGSRTAEPAPEADLQPR